MGIVQKPFTGQFVFFIFFYYASHAIVGYVDIAVVSRIRKSGSDDIVKHEYTKVLVRT